MSNTITNTPDLPFVLRHAPSTFGELVFADLAVRQRLALYASNQLHGNVILHGPVGTAKSATALTIVRDRRAMSGDGGPYVHHYLGGALTSGLGQLLGSLNLMLMSEKDPRPYIVIDEADQLSRAQQQTLRHMLDTTRDLRLIMTTNAISAVDGALQDRCECVPMTAPQPSDWLQRARDILAAEGIVLPNAALLPILAATKNARSVLRELEVVVVQHGMAAGATVGVQATPPLLPSLSVVPGNTQVSSAGFTIGNMPHLTVLPAHTALKPSA
jgi:replication-associated recombination protein RarA